MEDITQALPEKVRNQVRL